MNTSVSRILFVSTASAFTFAVIGIVWGIYSSSQMILFDGLYSIISLVMSLMAILASQYINKDDEKKFPFGKTAIQPMIVVMQAIVMGLLCVSALTSSVIALLTGGREIAVGSALLYGFFSLVFCFAVQLFFSKNKHRSEFIRSEAAQWFMDTILSLAVVIGFLIALFLDNTPWAFIIDYIDPTMVLLAGLYFLSVPIKLIRKNGKELLMMTPDQDLFNNIRFEMAILERKYNIQDSWLRMAKMSDVLYLDIDIIVSNDSTISTIEDSDMFREEFQQQLDQYDVVPWVTIAFTKERKWAE
ncbi:cation diffusion facilitator family transporter [Salicibibacter cibi]|uniref:Cation diffusion facilitator family transporter n=1 Tax=Salicibibacter cibi TaxID=2743001 RepID=A0A7T6Z811_9BACI|nr:cation diffusion facilitator family transporter [Salicibibacter cibi]QQK78660.1 cation diffusion facilitator family transporter [Salicibibacter cibi]